MAAWVWQGCHTLLWLALFCDEVEFMSCQYSIFFFVTNSVSICYDKMGSIIRFLKSL